MLIKKDEAKPKDVKTIQKIEKEYYEGYACPQSILKSWIKNNSNFLIAKKRGKLVAFLFFETINQIKTLPFVHKPYKNSGRYLYVSEMGILDKYARSNVLEQLFKDLIEKNRDKKGVIWVTGGKSKHDRVELKILKKFSFKRLKKILKWEAYPNYFVSDHWLWFKNLK